MRILPFAGLSVSLLSTTALSAELPDAAALFGSRESIEQASISPDGTKFAYLAPLTGQGSALFVTLLNGGAEPKAILIASGKPERLSNCKWAANTRLVCSIYGITLVEGTEIAYFSRLVGVDDDGKNVTVLHRSGQDQLGYDLIGSSVIDWLPSENGTVLMARNYIPERSTGRILASRRDGLGVDRVDTRTLKSSTVEQPRASAVEYITDSHGNVRIMGLRKTASSGSDKGVIEYLYRQPDQRDWAALSMAEYRGEGFNPYAVDKKLNVAYGLKKKDGRYAAYTVDLDGSLKEKEIFSHPDVDVSGFVTIGRRERIVGARYSTDKAEVAYFDPELQKLSVSLSKAIPNLPLIRFADSSVDETKLLIWAGSDVDPGRYYLLDRSTKNMSELLPVRPHLDKVPLASVQHIQYPAADGTMVPGYLTLPPGKESAKGLPAIVMPHGGPGARDEWGFDWLSQYFANQGYAVLQPNFRGSAGYGDAWFQKNGFQNWRTAIGDVDDGGRWLVKEGIADPAKMAIVGWSYGGYAALQSAATEPGLFKAAIAIAPVTDLDLLKEERRGWSDFSVVSAFVGSGPHIKEGSPSQNADKIKVPVLMFHGSVDRNVGVGHAKRMASRLKAANVPSDLVIYDDLDHYLEDSAARTDMLRKSADFLKKALKL
ncbi:alpha/beta hydrolase family protein [Allosphingosinicella vermicomposti]|uniref:alpha/beta hydrolase family protein n=1 Tax=Allosphingosinicella vermicomposti TaxID=614671 RepID=UPI000D11168F|nr:S9 family peptidase [Allosphingosinicella vermicomposti]